MTNTKKEMIEAYKAMKQQLEATEKQLLDAEKVQDIANRAVAAAKREIISVRFYR